MKERCRRSASKFLLCAEVEGRELILARKKAQRLSSATRVTAEQTGACLMTNLVGVVVIVLLLLIIYVSAVVASQ